MLTSILDRKHLFARHWRTGVLLGGLLAGASSSFAGGAIPVPGTMGSYQISVQSLDELRFHSVVAQRYDYSCGSAALATLLSYHYGRRVDEIEAFDWMYATGDQVQIQAQGFSMMDMKRYLSEAQGLASDGFRISLSRLEELGLPAIAMIEPEGYRHFVVVKGVRDDRVLVGDPAFGIRDYPRRVFDAIRSNDIFFIIRDELELARQSLNSPRSWAAITRAPLGQAIPPESLSTLTLHLQEIHP